MLRDFTVQPAAGGSPAGKAYTHQFPEHVFLYLGMFLIEHVLILHREARCWLLIGHGPSYDGALSPSPVRRTISQKHTAKLHRKRRYDLSGEAVHTVAEDAEYKECTPYTRSQAP